jgi:paraquat-inducible protein B
MDKTNKTELKIRVIETQLNEIKKKIDIKFNELESLTSKFDELTLKLDKLKYNPKVAQESFDLINKFQNPQSFKDCKTSEQIIKRMMKEIDYIEKMENKMKHDEDGVEADSEDGAGMPSISDNAELWERRKKAHNAMNASLNSK